MTTRRALAILLALTAACAPAPIPGSGPGPGSSPAGEDSPPVPRSEATLIFLVRHAETTGEPGGDPPLSAAGERRADRLAGHLADAGIAAVHSTRYQRTMSTAAPFAAAAGLPIRDYDPRDLPALADRLRAAGGRHLVVGHSNTTPQLVSLLGGDPVSDIPETEYDRLYLLVLEPGGAPADAPTVLLRY